MNFRKWNGISNKSVGTGPLSYEKRIYRAAVSQRLRNANVFHNIRLDGAIPLLPTRLYVLVLNSAPI